jgi:aquaporin Z
MRRGSNAMNILQTLRKHLPEYLIEAFALGMFMVSAGIVTTAFEHPGFWLRQMLPNSDLRRILTGVAMGLTLIAIVYSPWGGRSGAHMNPAVTLAFWRLGKIRGVDAAAYVVAQFAGGLLGVMLVAGLVGRPFTAPPVNWVATLPGSAGPYWAFVAELLIAAGMMTMILVTAASSRFARYTGVFAGMLVAIYISVEGPLSGMSMNPARTFASAAPAMIWHDLWIYFTAPLLGMFLAVEIVSRAMAYRACAKLRHATDQRCIHCGYEPVETEMSPGRTGSASRGAI